MSRIVRPHFYDPRNARTITKNMVSLAQFTKKLNLPRRRKRCSNLGCTWSSSYTGGLKVIRLLLVFHLLLLLSLLVPRGETFTKRRRRGGGRNRGRRHRLNLRINMSWFRQRRWWNMSHDAWNHRG